MNEFVDKQKPVITYRRKYIDDNRGNTNIRGS